MREICIPLFGFEENDNAEVMVKLGDKRLQYDFRVVSFKWEVNDVFSNGEDDISKSLARIARLKKSIKEYDKDWELIQIFNPLDDAKYIQVLYRKRIDQ